MTLFRYVCVMLVVLAGSLAAGSAEAASRRPAAPAARTQPVPMPETRIAAVVNDEVISVYDLMTRVRMVIGSSNIQDTPETRQRIVSQVLRTIVDEKLQMQEAKKQNVTATDEEINRALQQIAKQNSMSSDQLDGYLKARGIDRSTLIEQLTASIVWAKLVRRQASQSNDISDEEIDEAMARLKEHANEPQSRVAEIFLAVDNPQQEEEVRRLAERLIEQMKQGARFSAVAQQFSQSATAAVGGDIGWVRPDQIGPDLGKAIASLKPGELSPPIRTGAGFYVMLVLDRRTGNTGGEQETSLDIVQVVFPLPPQASESLRRAALAQAQEVRSAAKDCPQMLKIGKEKAPKLSSEGKLTLSQITPNMRDMFMKLPIGQASEPIVQKNGIGVVMVCSKSTQTAGLPSREDVSESLLRQRLDTVARRYLRDLRRNAFVDVRV